LLKESKISQDHRRADAGRDLWRPPSPTPGSKQGQLQISWALQQFLGLLLPSCKAL